MPERRSRARPGAKTRHSRKSEKSDRTAQPRQAAGRPIWTGQIRLALVTVPIRLYTATRSGAHLSFHQVHGPSGQRIHYQKVAKGVGLVRNEDIVKGYEI